MENQLNPVKYILFIQQDQGKNQNRQSEKIATKSLSVTTTYIVESRHPSFLSNKLGAGRSRADQCSRIPTTTGILCGMRRIKWKGMFFELL
jgi:hypothetical protein